MASLSLKGFGLAVLHDLSLFGNAHMWTASADRLAMAWKSSPTDEVLVGEITTEG